MGIPVLVVESNIENGKLIKDTLEAGQHFQVTVATRAIEALMRFTETKFRVTIVDFGLPDLNGADLIRQMRGIDDNIIVLAVLDNKEVYPGEIKQLAINAVLDKKNYLSNLPQKLIQLLRLPSQKPSPVKPSSIPSTKKPQSQHDDRTPKTTIQDDAAQIGSPTEETTQQEALKKEIPEVEPVYKDAHSKEVAQTETAQHLDKEVKTIQDEPYLEEPRLKEVPLSQAPRKEPSQSEEIQHETDAIPPWLKEPAQVEQYLAALEQEHSAYGTLLSIGNTPWTYSEQISENQAHGIVRLLSEHDEGLQNKGALIRYIRLSGTGNDYLLYATPVIGNINLSLIFSMDTPFSVARRQTHRLSRLLVEQDPREILRMEERTTTEERPLVSEEEDEPLLPSEWIPTPKTPTKIEEPPVLPETPAVVEEPPVLPEAPAVVEEPPVLPEAPAIVEEPQRERVMAASFTAAPEIAPIPNDWVPKEPKPSSHLPFLEQEAAQPEKVTELEPINLAQQEPMYYLPFTAILLPRFPTHRLTGSLANQLENWLDDLCVAWSWRVDHIDLRPEFLRFTISLSPDVAPAQAVQHLANNLSSRILNAFPRLKSELPSGQFWTKSYLLTAGSDVGKDRLASFIETTRKEQGLVN